MTALTITANRIANSRLLAYAAATALIAFGFVIDGISEVGHHAGLILGGITVGRALTK